MSFFLVSESNKNDTKIILTDGVKFVWKKVPGASNYLLRLHNYFLKENSLLGCGDSTSVEIPYRSLPFKRESKKGSVTVTIEVLAFGNSRIIGNGMRYTNVGMYFHTPFFHQKRRYLGYTGEKFMCILNLDPLLPGMSESVQTSTALRVRGL